MLTYKDAAPVQQTLFVWVTEKNYNREKEKNLQHGCTISEKKHSGLGLVDDLHLLFGSSQFLFESMNLVHTKVLVLST